MLNINPSEATPIWKQIEDEVRRLVAGGHLAGGAPVPSVRDLARQLRINPATVARAYQSLVDQDILVMRRGDGTYVAEQLPTISKSERTRSLREAATKYIATAITIGADHDAVDREVEAAWKRLGHPTQGESK